MTVDDVLTAELASGQAVPTATAGEPYESWRVISDDGQVEIGIWQVTPGSFRGETKGIDEFMHIVAGAGTITAADGSITELRPGVLLFRADGWSGRWSVTETIRKTYTIVKTT
jgi:uncharacterized protein